MSNTISNKPSFGLQRYRTHKRARSENVRQSTTWDAGIKHLNGFQPDQKSGMVRASSLRTSDRSGRKQAPAPLQTLPEDHFSQESGRGTAPRTSAAATFQWHHPSNDASQMERLSPVPPAISKKAAGMLGVEDSSASSKDELPTFQERKRPPKALMEPYGEGFYGLARLSMCLSDTCLDSLEDGEQEEMEEIVEDVEEQSKVNTGSLDRVSEGLDADVARLIRETNKAFQAVERSLDVAQLGSPEVRASTNSGCGSSSSLDRKPSKEFELVNNENTSSDLKEQASWDSSNSTDSKHSKDSFDSQGTRSDTTEYSEASEEPVKTLDLDSTQQPQQPEQPEQKPVLKSHWSDSSSGSVSSYGVSHAPTAPLPPMRPRQHMHANRQVSRKKTRGGSKSRWGFSEGVHDILTGQRFKKPEVEELLTPERLAQLKKSRAEASREIRLKPAPQPRSRKASLTVQSTDPAQTEVDNDDDDSDAKEHDIQEDVSIGGSARNSTDTFGDNDAETSSDRNSSINLVSSGDLSEGESIEDVEVMSEDDSDSGLPSLPAKNPARQRNSEGTQASQNEIERELGEEDDANIYLRSTPFSLTRPDFKHGPIIFSKAELGRAALTMDDAMDWTAFQMAILGGAGELNSEKINDDDEHLGQELADWFGSFEADVGGLVGARDDTSTPGSSRSSLSSRCSSLISEEELPVPREAEDERVQKDEGEIKFYQGGKIRQWQAEGSVEPRVSDRETKLPAGRDMELKSSLAVMDPVVADNGDDMDNTDEQIRMGFNLNSDLNDYLNWEQGHMSGNGF